MKHKNGILEVTANHNRFDEDENLVRIKITFSDFVDDEEENKTALCNRGAIIVLNPEQLHKIVFGASYPKLIIRNAPHENIDIVELREFAKDQFRRGLYEAQKKIAEKIECIIESKQHSSYPNDYDEIMAEFQCTVDQIDELIESEKQ